MATVPLSGTDIRFLSGIPFANDYKHTRWFASRSQQTTWFQSRNVIHSMSQANFQRIEGKHYVAVNRHIDELWGTNYLMFRNADYNNKWFYGFVTQLEYKNRSTTHVHFEIDVLQTWRFDMNFKPSYVIREHQDLWNSDGSPVINTLDEGLDYGTEYDNVYTTVIRPEGNLRWLVIVSKETIHSGDDREVDAKTIGVPQPLSYYVVPFDNNGNTPNFATGSDSFPLTMPTRIMEEIYEDQDAVNNIVSMYVTDYIGVPYTYSSGQPSILRFSSPNPNGGSSVVIGDDLYVIKINDIMNFSGQVVYDENKWDGFANVDESKLLMYPYTVIVLDDFKGNRVEIKPEFIRGNRLRIRLKGSLGTSNFVTWGVADYNRTSGINQTWNIALENENALIDNSPEDVTILNDMLSAFLQGNKNSINVQRSQIQWNGVMNAVGNTIGGVASARQGNPVGVASLGVGVTQGLGNTVLDLQAIQAKQQDIGNQPPQIGKMGTNTAYNAGNAYKGIRLIKKQIKPEYRRKLGDFFKMFGYKSDRVKVPNLRTRQHFNYVQTKDCNITGNFNNEDLQELKNVFNNGITLWHVDDVGNYDLANGVR